MRSIFLSLGMFILLGGATLMMVERVVFDWTPDQNQQGVSLIADRVLTVGQTGDYELIPSDWASFCLMAVGSVTLLYAAFPKTKQA